ncbi:hypothetical protein OUZ56_017289 [Daphnia magna]|uniref:Uncharacterized protein n=1 Tax=Daphnia magna TaxID=35525 RepID=A0ABR0ASK9_9CRUS|nr:hypothetical protein OUZ56_017289 [Daphnia magna]
MSPHPVRLLFSTHVVVVAESVVELPQLSGPRYDETAFLIPLIIYKEDTTSVTSRYNQTGQ